MSIGLRRSARQEPLPMGTFQYVYWSWRWKRRVTGISTPTALDEATLGSVAVGIKDLDLYRGLLLRMLAT